MVDQVIDKLPSLYRILHAYVSWWVLLAIFLAIIALMVRYFPWDDGSDSDE